MIFEIIMGGGENWLGGERMGRPTFSLGKKLTGWKFRPVTPGSIMVDFKIDENRCKQTLASLPWFWACR